MSNRNEDWKNSNFKATFSNKTVDQDEISSLRASREKENYYNLNVATFTFGGRHTNANNLNNDNSLDNLNSNNFKKSNTNLRNNPNTSKDKEREKDDYETNPNYFNKQQNTNKYNNGLNNIANHYNNSIISNNTHLTNNSNDISPNVTVNMNNNNSHNNSNLTTNHQIHNVVFQGPTLINRIGDHNSFLAVVIHALWNLKFMRNFIINDLNTLNEKESKNKL